MNLSKNHLTVTVVIIALVAVAGYFGFKYYQVSQDPQLVAQAEANKLVAEVGNLMVLPEEETPVVATVSDLEELSTNPFFSQASEGDKVLIYPSTQKAILYSPTLKKIVEVTSINIGQPSASAPTSSEQ